MRGLQTPLLSILRAMHCRSTHHRFALDALPLIRSAAGVRLGRHLLSNHSRYLAGAKDPDLRFRDFHNHVIHVDDGYWGGAPRVAHQWYERLQRYLRTNRWGDAAHAAGVLSHYFTDPIQPLHTSQSKVDRILHRPLEWSVTKSYASLRKQWQADTSRTVFQLSDGPGWLGEAILTASGVAHEYRDTLLAHYDLKAARKNPAAAWDDVSRDRVSQLIGLCITGWARVLERTAEDAERARDRPLPRRGAVLPLLSAGVSTPRHLLLRSLEHRLERKKVNAMIDEFAATGEVVRHMSSEQRVMEKVCRVYVREREYQRQRASEQSNSDIRILPFSPASEDGDIRAKKAA
ncbi:zinc dependent phospholipase C family protein [Allorhodopirellula solitaria]|uniref:Phospholipase C/D domain-containing protein n=1 Tax=Allorhodopirellula solitaria TaxID=2527987 RepID=A0A5C5WZQ0_9BACT|nr:zinc dependent phospholipase C family protein [Allorhodopirellula solitaria]TWT56394.1 hypothetical protein CA85_42070 [Allorhodopirellula solitaria]